MSISVEKLKQHDCLTKGPVRPWPIFNSDPLVERHHTQKYYIGSVPLPITRRPRVNLTHIPWVVAMSRAVWFKFMHRFCHDVSDVARADEILPRMVNHENSRFQGSYLQTSSGWIVFHAWTRLAGDTYFEISL